MPLRRASYADLLPASRILAAAFKDNQILGTYMHPRGQQYPNDVSLTFLRMLREEYCKPTSHIFVTYPPDAETAGKITGVANWVRTRSNSPKPSLYTQVLTKAMGLYNWAENFLYPNRALDLSRVDIFKQSKPFVEHHWTGTRADRYMLDLIAVDPGAEKRGYGKELVKWGFDRAREEGVGCSVVSAPGKEGFYRACGFDVNLGKTTDEGGDDNPFVKANLKGETIFFWDNGIEPKGLKKFGET